MSIFTSLGLFALLLLPNVRRIKILISLLLVNTTCSKLAFLCLFFCFHPRGLLSVMATGVREVSMQAR